MNPLNTSRELPYEQVMFSEISEEITNSVSIHNVCELADDSVLNQILDQTLPHNNMKQSKVKETSLQISFLSDTSENLLKSNSQINDVSHIKN